MQGQRQEQEQQQEQRQKQIPKGNDRKKCKGNSNPNSKGNSKGNGNASDGWEENGVGEWVRLCGVAEAPGVNEVREAEARTREGKGVAICLANVEGELSAIGNVCPHRQGPLGAGWVEEGAVMCPWHAWAFDVTTGEARAPDSGRVEVYAVRVEGEAVLVEIEGVAG